MELLVEISTKLSAWVEPTKGYPVPHPCKDNTEVVVTIINYCPPPGCQGTLDLSQEAFGIIADPEEGKINIDFEQV